MISWLASTYIVKILWSALALKFNQYRINSEIKVNLQHNNSDQEHTSVPCMALLDSKHYPRRVIKRHGRFYYATP